MTPSNIEPINGILERIQNFPSMPVSCRYMLEHFSDPDADLGELAEQMKYDPGMTANVLKLANSAMYGSRGKIDSLKAAFVQLGMRQLFQMLVASGTAGMMHDKLPGYDLRAQELLEHSIWTAVAAEEMTHVLDLKVSDLMFTAGLLHDLGKLILDPFIVQECGSIKDAIGVHASSFEQIEEQVLGMSHAEAGARVMEAWEFPAVLVEAVRYHHEPTSAPENGALVCMVHVGDMLAYAGGVGSGMDGHRYCIYDDAVAELGIKTRTLEMVSSRTLDKMREIEGLLSS